jgi:hypothetical protein
VVHADNGLKTLQSAAANNDLRRLRQTQNGERKTGYSSPPSYVRRRDEGGRPRLTTATTTTTVLVCRLGSASTNHHVVNPRALEPTSRRWSGTVCAFRLKRAPSSRRRRRAPPLRSLDNQSKRRANAAATLRYAGWYPCRSCCRCFALSCSPVPHALSSLRSIRQNARQSRRRIVRQRRICHRTDRHKRFQTATSHRRQPDTHLL